MSSKVGPDPRLSVRIQSAVADVSDASERAVDQVKGIGVAEAARLIANAADLVGDAAEASDLGSTALEGGAKTLENARFEKLTQGIKIDAHKLGKAAVALENVATIAGGIQAGLTSENSTTTGKVAEGALVGAGTKLMINALSGQALGGIQAARTAAGAATLARVGNPLMLADMALNYAGEKMLGKAMNQKMGGYISGHAFVTPAKVLTAWADALIGGDDTALNKFAEQAKAGEYGVVYKGALQLGQVISDKLNVVDGIEATVNAAKKVSSSVSSSVAAASKMWDKGVSFLSRR